jgi:OOP family OmpA-OmpF porin
LAALIGHYYCDPLIQPPAPVVAEAPPPAPPPPPPPIAQERIVLRGVHFDFNKARIRPDAVPILDEAANILNQHPKVNVDVNGYCDAIGGVAYNLKLSQRRADVVLGYLEDKGIAGGRLTPHGYGKANFVATNATAEGRAQNRRVELVPQQ